MSLYNTGHPPSSGATDEGAQRAVARQGDHRESSLGDSKAFDGRNVRGLGDRRGASSSGRLSRWRDEYDYVTSRAMEMLGDSRSSAHGVARMLDRAPFIADRVIHCAKGLYEKGPVKSTAHAVILIGYRRLQRILESVSDSSLRAAGGFAQRWAFDTGESKRPKF